MSAPLTMRLNWLKVPLNDHSAQKMTQRVASSRFMLIHHFHRHKAVAVVAVMPLILRRHITYLIPPQGAQTGLIGLIN